MLCETALSRDCSRDRVLRAAERDEERVALRVDDAPLVLGEDPAQQLLVPIRRGDVVVFKYPEEPWRDFIKRVIGLPGETIEIRGRKVYVNGSPLDEDDQVCTEGPASQRTCEDADPSAGGPYAVFFAGLPRRADDPESGSFHDGWGPQVVPPGHLLVLGDNRDNSADGRVWGYLPIDQVKGRALLVYWSYEATREEYHRTGLVEWVKDTLSAFGRTRWKRFFHVIH